MATKEAKKSAAKLTQTERVRRQLEEEVLTGLHQPGDRLDEVGLSLRLGCSRTPVREALNQLVAVGLLVRRNHCGVHVADRTADMSKDMAEAYAVLEEACLELALDRVTNGIRKSIVKNSRSANSLIEALRKRCGNLVLQEMTESQKARVNSVLPFWGVKGDETDKFLLAGLTDALSVDDPQKAKMVIRQRVKGILDEIKQSNASL
jgi:DNA-binding transcriptional regulator YhcF (GntR family)